LELKNGKIRKENINGKKKRKREKFYNAHGPFFIPSVGPYPSTLLPAQLVYAL
jgi:hypothetical protein